MWKILRWKSLIMAQRVILKIKTEHKKTFHLFKGGGAWGLQSLGLEGIGVWRPGGFGGKSRTLKNAQRTCNKNVLKSFRCTVP
jgi:hypothetical protein